MKITRKRILQLVLVLVLLGVCFPILYYFLFLQFIRVPTSAMANTIIPGDNLIVKKRAFGEVTRGDLIVFKYPKDTSVRYLKRVVGLPRETIEIRGRSVYVNGQELPEQRVTILPDQYFGEDGLKELSTEGTGPYRVFYFNETGILPGSEDYPFGSNGGFQIPENEYFVMGDNRDNSEDSRYWGTVPAAFIVGKPTMIYWSSYVDAEGNEAIRWNRVLKELRK